MPTLDLSSAAWRKSSRSDGNCVEVASTRVAVAVRDTKDRDGAVLIFPTPRWVAFVEGAKHGYFDLDG